MVDGARFRRVKNCRRFSLLLNLRFNPNVWRNANRAVLVFCLKTLQTFALDSIHVNRSVNYFECQIRLNKSCVVKRLKVETKLLDGGVD